MYNINVCDYVCLCGSLYVILLHVCKVIMIIITLSDFKKRDLMKTTTCLTNIQLSFLRCVCVCVFTTLPLGDFN